MSTPWMPFYPVDYLGDTAHLSTVEHGAYLLLILHYWNHEGLPDNEEDLAIITRLQIKDWRKIQPKIAKMFRPGWLHKRVDAELAKAKAKHLRRVQAGQTGGIAKANRPQKPDQKASKTPSNATPFARAMLGFSRATTHNPHSYPSQERNFSGEGTYLSELHCSEDATTQVEYTSEERNYDDEVFH